MGIGFGKEIENKLKRIEKIKKFSLNPRKNYKLLSKPKVDKLISKVERDIKNKITDVQWKCANFLTNQYKTILVGNMSTSGMKKTFESQTAFDTKKKLNMYQFREKIKYKCFVKGCNYKRINEAYTTQCCVKCGTVHKIGGLKEYKCTKCLTIHDRDVKSAGCIYLKALKLQEQKQQ